MIQLTNKVLVAMFATLFTATATFAEVKIALDGPKGSDAIGTSVWASVFGEYISKHGMSFEEFERGSLGGEAEKLDQVSQGLLEVSMSDTKMIAALDPMGLALLLPYFFANADELDRTLLENGMLDVINQGTTKKGVRVLDIAHIGGAAGIFNTKHPVASISDLSDLRIRALDDTQVAILKAWGSNGVVVAWDEVPNALQTGIADGYLNPPNVPLMFGHTSFIKHFTNANALLSTRAVLASEDWYQSLSEKEKIVIADGVKVARAENRKWLEGQASILKQLEVAGIEVIQLEDSAFLEFRKATEALYSSMPFPEGGLATWTNARGE